MSNIENPLASSDQESPVEVGAPGTTATIIPFPPGTQTVTIVDASSIVVPQAPKGGEDGKGGATPPSALSAPTNRQFLDAIFSELPEGAEIAILAKAGDPQTGGWSARGGCDVETVCRSNLNNYFNCASLLPTEKGELAARKDRAVAYHALVLDDIGTKVDSLALGDLSPSWELETSPGNFQMGFKLSPPMTDPKEVERLQQRVAAAGLTDNGALGMVRFVRLPIGINGKPKYEVNGEQFACRLITWDPDVAYTAEELESILLPATSPNGASKSTAKVSRPPRQSASAVSDVYFPCPTHNQVLGEFKRRGLYKGRLTAGKHEVTCPWVGEHTDALDRGAAYFEPDDAHPSGGFCCQHSHRDRYHLSEVLKEFGLSSQAVRRKPLIRLVAGEMHRVKAAAEAEIAKRDDFFQAGGVIVLTKTDAVTGDAVIEPVGEAALTMALCEAAEWENYDKRISQWVRCDPPVRHVSLLYRATQYDQLRILKGLSRQPYYDESTGELITTAGYDLTSQRIGVFEAARFPKPESTEPAARAALALLMDLLDEFHFASDMDRAAALGAIFTAVTRPALGLAPAFHVTAPSSGSGKSFLCEVIGLFAGPGLPARVSYPKTSEEATKVMLSLLMAGPAVIEFDDMDTDWLPHGAINRMLTAPSITDRILGVSKVATVRTSALVLGSGNNVGPIKDLSRRVVTINLNAKSEAPGMLSYRGNPVATLRAERERYVTAVLTIIEAWKEAGKPKAPVPSIASYGGAWSNYCRQPLLWLGLPDPATPLLEQMKHDPEANSLLRVLEEWHKQHGDKPLTLRKLLENNLSDNELDDALMDLHVVERGAINRSRLGHYLKRNQNRILGGLTLQKVPNAERNAWRVVKVAKGEGPAAPSSPPLLPAAMGQPEEAF